MNTIKGKQIEDGTIDLTKLNPLLQAQIMSIDSLTLTVEELNEEFEQFKEESYSNDLFNYYNFN